MPSELRWNQRSFCLHKVGASSRLIRGWASISQWIYLQIDLSVGIDLSYYLYLLPLVCKGSIYSSTDNHLPTLGWWLYLPKHRNVSNVTECLVCAMKGTWTDLQSFINYLGPSPAYSRFVIELSIEEERKLLVLLGQGTTKPDRRRARRLADDVTLTS